jgi:hypothetical protein
MKKIICSLLLLSSLFSFAQDTVIPDVNFEKRLIELNYDTGIPDGKVPTANIANLTYLNVDTHAPRNSSEKINDLTGIQDFTELRTLWCNNNNLSAIDVTRIVYLKNFQCNNNNLSSIDVSRNLDLNIFMCAQNKLTTLDVSRNLALTNFFCSNNLLTTIDVLRNTRLGYFGCGSNQITSLDVSQNIKLINLFFESTAITTIDVSKNVLLQKIDCNNNRLTVLNTATNIDLLTLDCYKNLITSLDLSNNIKLNDLNVNSNRLSSLNVSQNINLYRVQCGGNPSITSLDFSKNIKLNDLSLSGNLAYGGGGYLNNLKYLNLKNGNNSNLNSSGTPYIPNLITTSPNLTCIQVDDVAYSNTNWTNKDATASYNTNCTPIIILPPPVAPVITVFPNPCTVGQYVFISSTVAIESFELYTSGGTLIVAPNIIKQFSANRLNANFFAPGRSSSIIGYVPFYLKIKTLNNPIITKQIFVRL